MQNQARELFLLQADVIESKVEINVSKAISQVVEQIVNLRAEMHQEIGGLRQEMHAMGQRLSAVEAVLGMRVKARDEIRNRFYDYAFKASWLILGSLLTFVAIHFAA